MIIKSIVMTVSLYLFCVSKLCANSPVIDPYNIFPTVKLETSMGIIIVELDRLKAPITVDNFLNYVVKKEYDNTLFHRVIKGFVAQGGGYSKDFSLKKVTKNIINESGNGLKNESGTIAMAKESKPHTANRQFFFNLSDNKNLDPGRRWGYAVFGSITEGQDVLEAIGKVKTQYNNEVSFNDVPVEPVILIKATLLPSE